jgi:hypothetical protein
MTGQNKARIGLNGKEVVEKTKTSNSEVVTPDELAQYV